MGWFNRKSKDDAEERAVTYVPWWPDGAPGEVTPAAATQVSAVFASMRILSENIASLPLEAYRKQANGELNPQPFVPPLFYKPSATDTRFQWVSKCVVSLVLRGNAYGRIIARDNLGYPTQVEWLNPDDMDVDESSPVKPVYRYRGLVVDASDIVHIPWITMPGSVVGLSPVQHFASLMGVSIAATNYGRRWFDSGGLPPAILKNTAKGLNPEESRLVSRAATSAIATGKPFVMGNDWDFTALSVNPDEAQFLNTIKANATQIASIYGVPPTMVGGEPGGSMTYANVEMEVNNLIVLTLRPWLVRLETEFSALLSGGEEVRFNVDAMIRTSVKERYENHNLAIEGGWMNVDEVRAKENLPPLPNGEGKKYKGTGTPPPPPPVAPEPPEGVTE